jgi:hypothetical protein
VSERERELGWMEGGREGGRAGAGGGGGGRGGGRERERTSSLFEAAARAKEPSG